jgi:hypothetical protein
VGVLMERGTKPRAAGAAVMLALVVAVVVVQPAAVGALTPTTSSTTSIPCPATGILPAPVLSVDPTTFAPGQTIHLSGRSFVAFSSPPATSADGCPIPSGYSGPSTAYLVVGGRTYVLATPIVTNGGYSIEVVVPLTVSQRGLGYVGTCTCNKYLPVTVVDPIGPPTIVEGTPHLTG